MNGYLIAEEGPLAGKTIALEEEKAERSWTLGRDPDAAEIVLEDPMVSRKHVIISLSPEGFRLENLSSVNPATQNGKVIVDPVLLQEGDIIQIGSTFFRFTEQVPTIEEKLPEEEMDLPEETIKPPAPVRASPDEARWLIKVISGPNAGAEFAMQRDSTYIIGKDPGSCDIIFQDLSVSRQHARLEVDAEDQVFIEDLGSRNGVIVNGELISEKQPLSTQDLIALGTTSFIVIDRKATRETILAPPTGMPAAAPTPKREDALSAAPKKKRDWREIIIPKRHLIFAGFFAALILVSVASMLSLFRSETVVVKKVDESEQIAVAISKFPAVKFSFNQASGKLFLVGHVLTQIEKQELIYTIKQLPYIEDIEDTIIVDELVWQNVNDLLSTNPNWVAVTVTSPVPGKFVLRGYLQTPEQQQALSDFINLNFPYLDRLDNQVVIEKNLQTQIQSMITEKGYLGVNFELTNGEVVFSGRIEETRQRLFEEMIKEVKKMPGIRLVKNYVAFTSGNASFIDLSENYQVTGYSKRDEADFFVVINGRILGSGDILDGMMITKVQHKVVLLEKDGLKYRINYNLQ